MPVRPAIRRARPAVPDILWKNQDNRATSIAANAWPNPVLRDIPPGWPTATARHIPRVGPTAPTVIRVTASAANVPPRPVLPEQQV